MVEGIGVQGHFRFLQVSVLRIWDMGRMPDVISRDLRG